MAYTSDGDYNQNRPMGATDQQIMEWGNYVLTLLHNELKAAGYKGTREQMINTMSVNTKGEFMPSLVPITIEGFGLQAEVLGMPWAQVSAAFKNLASQSQGRVPTRQTAFNAMGNKASNPSWIEAVTYTATQTAKDVASSAVKTAENVGNAVSMATKITTWLIPAIPIVILLGLFLRAKGGKMDLSGVKSLGAGAARRLKGS